MRASSKYYRLAGQTLDLTGGALVILAVALAVPAALVAMFGTGLQRAAFQLYMKQDFSGPMPAPRSSLVPDPSP